MSEARGPRVVDASWAGAVPASTAAATIPPPPPRTGTRAGNRLDASQFDVRPQVSQSVVAAAAESRAEGAVGAEQPAAEAVHVETIRAESHRAAEVPLAMAAQGGEPKLQLRTVSPRLAAFARRHGDVAPMRAVERRADPREAASIIRRSAASALKRESEGTREEPAKPPAFTLAAPGSTWVPGKHMPSDAGQMNALLRDAFTPTRPKQQSSVFSGRYRQMQRIIAAIEEERAHIVIYGERGSGKTSLANIIAGKAEEAGYLVLKLACSSELGFDDIFRTLLRRVPATFLADGIGATMRAGIDHFEQLLPQREFSVAELIAVLQRIYDKHVIMIIDEYDRVRNEDTKNKLAELIKNMSDASAPVTLLLIGVAENVDELLGKHPSLQRTLVTVPLPLMSRREIEGIIATGEQRSGLTFEPEVRRLIVEFAQGLPYHAQLLSLFAARSALRRGSQIVAREDLRYAVQRAAEEAEHKIKEAYALAIGSQPGSTSFKDVLFAAARCRCDEFGVFTAADVAAAAAKQGESNLSTLSLQYPLKKLTEPERGAVLRRLAGPEGLRYQFCNQMMRHYVLVRQAIERKLV